MTESNDDDKTIEYYNGDRYEGQKDKQGRPHGHGVYTHHNERGQIQQGKYDGEWEDGEKHGNGKHWYRNGDIYEGPWENGKRHGSNGTYTYYKHDSHQDISLSYEGQWKHDQKHGQGIMMFTNGDKYQGQWENGQMCGNKDDSTYTHHDKQIYHGKFTNDTKHGKGKIIYDNGDIYQGGFKNGKRHGKGTYTFKQTGIATEGLYENDKRTTYKVVKAKQHSSDTETTDHVQRQTTTTTTIATTKKSYANLEDSN